MKIFYTLLFSLFLFIMGFTQKYDSDLEGYGYSKDIAIVSMKGKYGIISSLTKKILVPLEYSYIQQFDDSLFIVKSDNHKFGIINKLGKIVIKPEYENIIQFDYNWIKLKQNNKYGLVNIYDGKEILPIRYNYIGGVYNNVFLAVIYDEDKKTIKEYSLINSLGKKIIQFDEYTEDNLLANFYINGLFTVKLNGKYALYNSAGEIIPPLYKYIIVYYDKWVKARNEEGKYDLFDITGKKIASYDYIQFTEENTAIIRTGEKVGYMNFETGVFIPENHLREEMKAMKVIFEKSDEEIKQLYHTEDAEFPEGGKEKFSEYLSKILNYPDKALDRRKQCKIVLGFIINREGEISSAFTLGFFIGDGIEEEAIRTLYKTKNKKWKPARIEGIAIDSFFIVPITFRLPE